MRASSLSDRGNIELLARYFVPVWLSTDDHGLVPKDRAEAEEYLRYRKAAKSEGLSAGNVQVYLILPDGKLLTTLHVAKAAKADALHALLQRTVDEYKVPQRESVESAQPVRPRSRPKEKDAAEFHIVARHTVQRADWGLAESWVTLTPDQCAAFIPRATRNDFAWEVPPATANLLYRHLYPPVPNYDEANGSVEESTLTARIAAIEDGRALVLLRGRMKLAHRIGGKQTDGEIRARLSGYVLVDVKRRKLEELALITDDDAEFVWHWQGKPQPSKFAGFVEFDAPAAGK